MKILYSPWRSKYANSVNKKDEKLSSKDCPFCNNFKSQEDEKNYVIKRYKYNVLVLNLYPYNAGHMMAIPLRHIANLSDLKKEEKAELMEVVSKASEVCLEDLKAHGVNIGLNLGKAAGAGIPSHLHIHILPRWNGDTNFMPLLAQTKTISFDLNEVYKDIKKYF